MEEKDCRMNDRNAIRNRRSVRTFDEKRPLSEETKKEILSYASFRKGERPHLRFLNHASFLSSVGVRCGARLNAHHGGQVDEVQQRQEQVHAKEPERDCVYDSARRPTQGFVE